MNSKKADSNPVVKVIKNFNVPADKVFDAWLQGFDLMAAAWEEE